MFGVLPDLPSDGLKKIEPWSGRTGSVPRQRTESGILGELGARRRLGGDVNVPVDWLLEGEPFVEYRTR
ncbi:MAG: hypothetical protein KKA32_06220, partial [Actinobacteria bacterium]|nr:hypothetical protein [Actinomycetota bacterium]